MEKVISNLLTRLTDWDHIWVFSRLRTTHLYSFLFFFSPHQFISSAGAHLFSNTPSLPVCGESHQWASGADVQVSGGDQHSYPRKTGPGGEGGPAGGAQRHPGPGPQPSVQVGQLRPEPVWLWRPEAQWRKDCTRRETWWMNSSSPPSPIISSPLLSLFNQSTHYPVFGHFHRIKLTLSLVVCLCVCCRMLGSRADLVLAEMETFSNASIHLRGYFSSWSWFSNNMVKSSL